MKTRKKPIFGFTMIELLIVMGIIGLLATLIGGNYISVKKKGRDAERKHDLVQIQSAFEMYFNDQGRYPAVGVFTFGETWQGASNLYMKQVPQDPRNMVGSVYVYETDANGTYYQLYAKLENDLDLDYYSGGYGSTDCGGGEPCTYAVSSPNRVLPTPVP